MSREAEIQLELLKGDCVRLLTWVRCSDDVTSWVRTNVEQGLRRAEISIKDDAAIRRRLLKELAEDE